MGAYSITLTLRFDAYNCSIARGKKRKNSAKSIMVSMLTFRILPLTGFGPFRLLLLVFGTRVIDN